jgi:hypothetical protein
VRQEQYPLLCSYSDFANDSSHISPIGGQITTSCRVQRILSAAGQRFNQAHIVFRTQPSSPLIKILARHPPSPPVRRSLGAGGRLRRAGSRAYVARPRPGLRTWPEPGLSKT